MPAYNFLKQRQLNVSGYKRDNFDEVGSRIKMDLPYHMRDFDRMSVLRYEIPKTWEIFDTTVNQNLTLTEVNGGSTNYPVTIWSPGDEPNPTNTEVAAALETALNAAGGSTAYDVTFSVSENDYKLSVSNTGGVITSFSLTTTSHTMARYLGLSALGVSKKNTSGYSTTNASPGTPSKLPASMNLQRYDELYIRTGLAKNNYDQLLLTINPHNGGFMETISGEIGDVIGNSVTIDTDSSSQEFVLMSDEGKQVVLNGHNWRFTCVCWKDSGNNY